MVLQGLRPNCKGGFAIGRVYLKESFAEAKPTILRARKSQGWGGLLMFGGVRGRFCEWKVCLCKGGFAGAKLPILRARKRQGFHVRNK